MVEKIVRIEVSAKKQREIDRWDGSKSKEQTAGSTHATIAKEILQVISTN